MSRTALLAVGTVAAQLYLLMVFAAALVGGNHAALVLVIMAEGLTAVGYQVQLLEDQQSIAQGLLTLGLSVASWAAGLLAGILTVV